MTFIHEDKGFEDLLRIVARETGVAAALVEKDYWVTHTLWALHQTKLEIWFKGGTSLSKGFGLIQRFSEDLDLMIQAGGTKGLPEITNWTSINNGPVERRSSYYDTLTRALVVPAVRVERDPSRVDKHARGADYLARYPGLFVEELASTMSPFVRLEVGRARVVPFVEKEITSFVHEYLAQRRLLSDYEDNHPRAVRCVHPWVTLVEKLEAITRRYARETIDADAFVRHYEDAAQIINAEDKLLVTDLTAGSLVADMLRQKDIAALPTPSDPAFHLGDQSKRTALERAHAKIAPMFWGPRVSLDDACRRIRAWLQELAP